MTQARAVLRDLLGLAAAWHAAAFKAARPPEPDRAAKRKAETKLAALLGAYFARLAKKAAVKLTDHPPKQQAEKASYVDDEFDDAFFDDDDFLTNLAALLLAASTLGTLSLPAMLNLELDLTATNTEAAAAARAYAFDLIQGLTDTARETLQTVISEFVTTPGMTLGDVIDRLPFDQQRAALIATTEITRAYATGQAAAGEALAGQFPDVRTIKKWYTNNDDRVCPICEPLHLTEVDAGDEFADGIDMPPAHPGCRCSISYQRRFDD